MITTDGTAPLSVPATPATPASFLRNRPGSIDPALTVPGMPPGYGQELIPHAITFQGLVSSLAHVYRPSDEALQASRDNARFMRNDLSIMECLEMRQRSIALLDWQVAPEDEKDARQRAVAEELTKILRRTRRFNQLREQLQEALWYGRSATKQRFGWLWINGQRRVGIHCWRPVHGDKLVFRYDDGSGDYDPDQIGIRVGLWAEKYFTPEQRARIEMTDWGQGYFLTDYERKFLAVHAHRIEDGEYEDPWSAGRIHGLGIRNRIYWTWYQSREALAWLMEFLERSAFGMELWYYPAGNPQAEQKTRAAAQERIGNGRNIVLVPRPAGQDAHTYGVDVVQANMAGAEVLQRVITEFFGHQIKRYVLGQTLTTEAAPTGLGSNLASIHLDTYLQIVRYDGANHEETMTSDVVAPLRDYNFPAHKNVHYRFQLEMQEPDVEAKLKGMRQAWEMGARVKESDVLEAVGISKPETTDDVLVNPEIAQARAQLQQAQQQQQAAAAGSRPAQVQGSGPLTDLGQLRRELDVQQMRQALAEAGILDEADEADEARPEDSERIRLKAYAGDWDEGLHPRDEAGQFAGKNAPSFGVHHRTGKGGGGKAKKAGFSDWYKSQYGDVRAESPWAGWNDRQQTTKSITGQGSLFGEEFAKFSVPALQERAVQRGLAEHQAAGIPEAIREAGTDEIAWHKATAVDGEVYLCGRYRSRKGDTLIAIRPDGSIFGPRSWPPDRAWRNKPEPLLEEAQVQGQGADKQRAEQETAAIWKVAQKMGFSPASREEARHFIDQHRTRRGVQWYTVKQVIGRHSWMGIAARYQTASGDDVYSRLTSEGHSASQIPWDDRRDLVFEPIDVSPPATPPEKPKEQRELFCRTARCQALTRRYRAAWDEKLHPRDDGGQFAKKGSGAAGGAKPEPAAEDEVIVPAENLGIARHDMPQITEQHQSDFLSHLERQGIAVRRVDRAIGELKGTQREINPKKVQGMVAAIRAGGKLGDPPPVIASRDGYILDGHHRWAAYSIAKPDEPMKLWEVDLPIEELLDKAYGYDKVQFAGIAHEKPVNKPLIGKSKAPLVHPEGTVFEGGPEWRASAEELLRGAGLDVENLADLVGAPDSTRVSYSVFVPGWLEGRPARKAQSIAVRVRGDGITADCSLSRSDVAYKGAHYSASINLVTIDRAKQGRGTGLQMFAKMAEHLRHSGVGQIALVGARDEDRHAPMFGYKVWPLFGFDGQIMARVHEKLPASLKHCRTIQDLYATRAGAAWWAEHGENVELEFDLREGSRSWGILDRYLRRKRAAEKIPEQFARPGSPRRYEAGAEPGREQAGLAKPPQKQPIELDLAPADRRALRQLWLKRWGAEGPSRPFDQDRYRRFDEGHLERYARYKSAPGQKNLDFEAQHPRDEEGRFAEKDGGATRPGGSVGSAGVLDPAARPAEARKNATRLRQLAETQRAAADRELGRDRLTNTRRRADMAASAVRNADRARAFAETCANIAEAIEAGRVEHLGVIRNRAQVETLWRCLMRARDASHRAEVQAAGGYQKLGGYAEQRMRERRTGEADLAYVQYPWPNVHVNAFPGLIEKMRGSLPTRPMAERMAEYVHEHARDEMVRFPTHEDAQFLRDWVAAAKTAGDGKWHRWDVVRIEELCGEYSRLQSMGIHDEDRLRAALAEFLPLRARSEGESQAAKLERELVGAKIPGFFPTPRAVGTRLLEAAEIEPGHRVLEPSAGKGDLVELIRDRHPEARVTALEISPRLHALMKAKGLSAEQGDFLEHRGQYDRIVMNPPFENGQDRQHVRHAYEQLAPGGRLVAVMSAGTFSRGQTADAAFRDWLDSVGGSVEELPEGSFGGRDAFRRTGVATRLVVIERPQ